MNKMTIELTQTEANLLLRALEEIKDVLHPDHPLCPGDEAAAKKLWSKIFNIGLDTGFGKETHNKGQACQ